MDTGYQLLAAKYIRRQAKQLAEQLDGVRAAEDIEFVHRARVATRRLRAALRVFECCFPKKRLRRWLKAIRRTTAKLGDARDRDVQMEFLCGALSTLNAKECFPGISRILVQLEYDRERLQRKVVKAVDRLDARGVLRDMQCTTKRALRDAGAGPENYRTAEAFVRTERTILQQLEEMLRHQDSLANPDEQERHHAMRIATKRLRYTLEITRPIYAGQLDEAVEVVKKVQTLLGDVHDCDVWAEHLDAFAAEERERIHQLFGHAGRFARLLPGINYLRQDRSQHRQEVFGQLVAYWTELDRRRFWERLTAVVLARGQAPAVAPLATPVHGPKASAPIDGTVAPPAASPQASPLPPSPEVRPILGGLDGLTADMDGAPQRGKTLLTTRS